MTPSLGTVNATFFYMPDTRTLDRTQAPESVPGKSGTSSSANQPWKWVKATSAVS